ncbi:hypothetical protein [Pantoea septica]|uniref:hypothetical protein n=1 Tax=Pantoea septica TaxID=472695 RepID=UPI001FD47B35|nr:hypothetical protein [Pantoea septica]
MQLTIDKLRAARFFAAHAQLVGGDQAIDDGFNGFSFFLSEKEPAGLVEGFRGLSEKGVQPGEPFKETASAARVTLAATPSVDQVNTCRRVTPGNVLALFFMSLP